MAQGRQRKKGFFSGMFRGVSNAQEGSKVLFFLYGPRLMCNSLLHLRSSWKVDSQKFARKVSKTTNLGNTTSESPRLRSIR